MFDLVTLTSRLLGSEKVIVEVQDLRRSNEHLSQSTSLWLVFQTAGRKVHRLCQHSMVSPAATLCGDDHSKLLLVSTSTTIRSTSGISSTDTTHTTTVILSFVMFHYCISKIHIDVHAKAAELQATLIQAL